LASINDLQTIPIDRGDGNPSNVQPQISGGVSHIQQTGTPGLVSHYAILPVIDIYANVEGRDLGAVSDEVAQIIKDMEPSLARGATDKATHDTAVAIATESAEHAQHLSASIGRQGEPWHGQAAGGYLRSVVYGFNDGLTANFGLVAGVIGAAVQPHVIMISGVAGMIADALSMGSSGYLAAKSEQEVWEHEIAMEKEEIRLMPEIEMEELELQYQAKGVDLRTARRMAEEVMRDPERALVEQVREELKIGEAHATPFREGWITGVSTAVGAFIPVFPFLILQGRVAIWLSFTIAMLSHFAVGAARSFFTGRGVIRSGIDMFVIGMGVAAVGYLVGGLVAKVL